MTRDKSNITEKKVKFWKSCTIFLVYLWKVTLRFKELLPNKILSHSVEKLLASNTSDGPRAANKFPKDFDSYTRYVIWMLVCRHGFNDSYREEREAKRSQSLHDHLELIYNADRTTTRSRSGYDLVGNVIGRFEARMLPLVWRASDGISMDCNWVVSEISEDHRRKSSFGCSLVQTETLFAMTLCRGRNGESDVRDRFRVLRWNRFAFVATRES